MKRERKINPPSRVKPVTKIELSEEHKPLRIALIVLCLVVAGVALGGALTAALSTEAGWQVVEVVSNQLHCGSDFVLNYDYTGLGAEATALNKQLTNLYSREAEKAFALFSPDVDAQFGNVRAVNLGVNTAVTVDSGLYRALETVVASGSRALYLAPVYALFDDLVMSELPLQDDPERDAYVQELMVFISDPDMIDLQLLGNDQVQLTVGQPYLDYAREQEITDFLDFHWMTNAFIADYLAGVLAENGFTRGYLSSRDGFHRNLDDRGTAYSLNLPTRDGNELLRAAVMDYTGPMSLVSLRNFPMDDGERWRYYQWPDGTVTTPVLNETDGGNRAAVESLTAYSRELGCGEILLRILPIYAADTLDEAALKTLAEEALHSVWVENRQVCHTDAALTLRELFQSEDIRYRSVLK